jgi:hypothetical protein
MKKMLSNVALSVIYAEGDNYVHYACCRYAGCRIIANARKSMVLAYHGLEAGVELNQERRLLSHGQDSLFHHGAFNIIILKQIQ